jgi:hypothetical protein
MNQFNWNINKIMWSRECHCIYRLVSQSHTHIHTHTNTHTQTQTHTHTHTHTNTHTHTHTHTRAHARNHAHTHTHTYTLVNQFPSPKETFLSDISYTAVLQKKSPGLKNLKVKNWKVLRQGAFAWLANLCKSLLQILPSTAEGNLI